MSPVPRAAAAARPRGRRGAAGAASRGLLGKEARTARKTPRRSRARSLRLISPSQRSARALVSSGSHLQTSVGCAAAAARVRRRRHHLERDGVARPRHGPRGRCARARRREAEAPSRERRVARAARGRNQTSRRLQDAYVCVPRGGRASEHLLKFWRNSRPDRSGRRRRSSPAAAIAPKPPPSS